MHTAWGSRFWIGGQPPEAEALHCTGQTQPWLLIPLSFCFLPASMNFVFFRFTMRLLYLSYCSVNWVSASSLLMVFPSITMGFSSSSPSSAYEVDASKTDISFTITFCNWNRWFRRRCFMTESPDLRCSGVLCSISIHTFGFFHLLWLHSLHLLLRVRCGGNGGRSWSTLNCRRVLLRRLGIV